ncbi:MAG: aa3-type cytochrome c oxidase subunit IV [Reyranellales bacterium]
MADVQDDYRAHEATYTAFSKLVLFVVLWLVLLLSCMALGLVGHIPVLAVLAGVGGTLALIVAFAVFG